VSDEDVDNETSMTEITIQPDGRVYVFGTSRSVLDLLAELNPRSTQLQRLLEVVQRQEENCDMPAADPMRD
jgi:hypothetical protein